MTPTTPPEDSGLLERALTFFYAQRDQGCTVQRIADGCGVSLSTLTRCMQDATGSPPGAFFRRLRLELAFRQLRHPDQAVIEVALAAGFEDHAAFSRAFRQAYGFPPSSARGKTRIQSELDAIALAEPDIVEMDAVSLRGVIAQGPYFACAAQAWRDLAQRMPEDDGTAMFAGMALDDPHHDEVAEDQVRFFAGVASPQWWHPGAAGQGWQVREVPAGPHARFRFQGKLRDLGLAYHHIHGRWREQLMPSRWAMAPRDALMLFDGLPAAGGQEHTVMICVPLQARPAAPASRAESSA